MSKFEKITVENYEQAWVKAAEILGCSFYYDKVASEDAGYPVHKGDSEVNCWISDLGNRLEVNMSNGSTINIWIEEEKLYTAAEVRQIITNAKRELEAIEKIIDAVKQMDISDAGDAVLAEMSMKRREQLDKLAQFGL